MSKKTWTLKDTLPYIFIVASVIGLIASFALTFDTIHVLKNPSYIPSCNINPILSCGDVMKTKQGDLLGVPNPVYGLMGFSMLFAFGLVLAAGGTLKSWLWRVINAGALAGFCFFVYLFFQATFRIHAICPWCFVIWMITPPVLWYTTLYNLREKHIRINQKFSVWLQKHHGEILFCWYLIVFLTLLGKFWYYWKTL